MSSFLMNTGPYVDPKFPPQEEYSQNSYIPPHSDYYGTQHYTHYGMPQAASMQYGREAMQYNHGYYQQACVMPQHQAMGAHISPQIAPCHSPLQQHPVPARSPVASPDLSQSGNASMGGQMTSHLPQGVEGSPEEHITELDANGQPIIYPWMKKIHVAGVCKFILNYLKSNKNLPNYI